MMMMMNARSSSSRSSRTSSRWWAAAAGRSRTIIYSHYHQLILLLRLQLRLLLVVLLLLSSFSHNNDNISVVAAAAAVAATQPAEITANDNNSSNNSSSNSTDSNSTTVFLWSSAGGGWRSMFACVGYVNAFQKAGLFGDNAVDNTNNNNSSSSNSKFHSIATNSGATWFSTQLFYSNVFYNKTVMAASPGAIYNFTVQWMDAYEQLLVDATAATKATATASDSSKQALLNDTIKNVTELEEKPTTDDDLNSYYSPGTILQEFIEVFHVYDGNWANFIQAMLNATTIAYGHDGDNFISIVAGATNRIDPLQNTQLLIQTALAPNSRLRKNSSSSSSSNDNNTAADDDDLAVYLGPINNGNDNNNNSLLYTVALSASYIVNETFTGFQYATFDSSDDNENPDQYFATYVSPTSPSFEFADWEEFYLWDGRSITSSSGGAVVTTEVATKTNNIPPSATFPLEAPMSPPFFQGGPAGTATVTQVGAVSSAAAGIGSPAVPSIFAQAVSQCRPRVGVKLQEAYDQAVNKLYQASVLDNVAVCSQWPNPCGSSDGWLIDGVHSDNPSLAINIAQYHISGGDLSKTLKVVLTNTNSDEFGSSIHSTAEILQYFATDFNEGIEPGGYIWIPASFIPRRSPQCFEDYLDGSGVSAALEPLNDSNMTTAILAARTTDNPAFGIRAGQKVEILLLNLNTDITTIIAGPKAIEENTIPLAEMASHIAGHGQLIQRVHAFFFPSEDGEFTGDESPPTSDSRPVVVRLSFTVGVMLATIALCRMV